MDAQPGQSYLVVIGASAGGVEALQALLAQLPADLPAALLVVLHIGARRSALPSILARAGPLPAAWAADGEAIQPGWVHIAPPDHHLTVAPDGQHLRLSRGPAENRTRPAIDPLFRSAARACGRRVLGILLSGLLSDGTAGLAEVVRRGGIAVVQDPEEAEYPDMPRSALRHVPVHHRLRLAGIAGLLERLRDAPTKTTTAEKGEAGMTEGHTLKRPFALTCPSCGGAVEQKFVDSLPYFECHIGHRFAARNFDEAQFEQLERALEVALRTLNERTELSRRLAEAALGRGQAMVASHWKMSSEEAAERAEVLRRFLKQGWERPSDDETGGGLAGPPTG